MSNVDANIEDVDVALNAELEKVEALPEAEQGLFKSILSKLTEKLQKGKVEDTDEDEEDDDEDDDDKDEDEDDEDDEDEDGDKDDTDDEDEDEDDEYDEAPLPAEGAKGKVAKKSLNAFDGEVDEWDTDFSDIDESDVDAFAKSFGDEDEDEDTDFIDTSAILDANTDALNRTADALEKSLKRERRLERAIEEIKKSFGEKLDAITDSFDVATDQNDAIVKSLTQLGAAPVATPRGGASASAANKVLLKSNGLSGDSAAIETATETVSKRYGMTPSDLEKGMFTYVSSGQPVGQSPEIDVNDIYMAKSLAFEAIPENFFKIAAEALHRPFLPGNTGN